MGKNEKYLRIAKERGYVCDKQGVIYSPFRSTPLKGYPDSRGYLNFSITYQENETETRKSVSVPIHRFQAFQKFGEKIFEKGIEVRHMGENMLDNSWDNIEIGTHRENMQDIPKHVRVATAITASNKIRKFTDEELKRIKEFHLQHKSYTKTMTEFNITSKGSLYFMLKNEYQTTK